MGDTMLKPIKEKIPQELKDLDQWVAWRLENGGIKMPVNPHTGARASVTDPKTWGTFNAAWEYYEKSKATGVGFVLSVDSPIVAIDIDGCMSVSPAVDSAGTSPVESILENFRTYTELSPSGSGLHVICRARKHSSVCRFDYHGRELEVYSDKRYITITGHLHGDLSSVHDCQAELDELLKDLPRDSGPRRTSTRGPGETLIVDHGAKITEDDLAAMAEANKMFQATWENARPDLPSGSEHCFALTNFGFQAGWPNQKILDLLVHFRGLHNLAHKPDSWYINWNIYRLEESYEGDRQIEAVDGVETAEATEQRVHGVTKVIGYPVNQLIQNQRDDATFSLLVGLNGTNVEVLIGSSKDFESQAFVRQRLQESVDHRMSDIPKKSWRKVLDALYADKKVVNEDVGTLEGKVRDMVRRYLQHQLSSIPAEDDEDTTQRRRHARMRLPIRNATRYYVNLDHAANWSKSCGHVVSPKHLSNELRKLDIDKRRFEGSRYWGVLFTDLGMEE